MLAHAGAVDESLAVAIVFAALWTAWIGWSRLRRTGFPRLPTWAGPALLAAGAGLLVASAIVPRALFGPTPAGEAAAPAAPAGPRPASTATLAIASPTDGEVVEGDQLEVVLDLEGGRVVDAAMTEVTADEGHIHLTVDGEVVSMTYGTVQVVDVRSLTPGEHTLEAEFVAADHAPFSPRTIERVTFVTEDG
jgi:hypothetical protein